MLVLSRKIGEKIMIGDDVSLTVSDVRGDCVRLAIDAPRSIKIYRGEIFEAIVNENRSAIVRNNQIISNEILGTSIVKNENR